MIDTESIEQEQDQRQADQHSAKGFESVNSRIPASENDRDVSGSNSPIKGIEKLQIQSVKERRMIQYEEMQSQFNSSSTHHQHLQPLSSKDDHQSFSIQFQQQEEQTVTTFISPLSDLEKIECMENTFKPSGLQ